MSEATNSAASPKFSLHMSMAVSEKSVPVTRYPRSINVDAVLPLPHPRSRALPSPDSGSGILEFPLHALPLAL